MSSQLASSEQPSHSLLPAPSKRLADRLLANLPTREITDGLNSTVSCCLFGIDFIAGKPLATEGKNAFQKAEHLAKALAKSSYSPMIPVYQLLLALYTLIAYKEDKVPKLGIFKLIHDACPEKTNRDAHRFLKTGRWWFHFLQNITRIGCSKGIALLAWWYSKLDKPLTSYGLLVDAFRGSQIYMQRGIEKWARENSANSGEESIKFYILNTLKLEDVVLERVMAPKQGHGRALQSSTHREVYADHNNQWDDMVTHWVDDHHPTSSFDYNIYWIDDATLSASTQTNQDVCESIRQDVPQSYPNLSNMRDPWGTTGC